MFLRYMYFVQVVEKEYSSHGRQQFSFIFGFKKDFISLKIPVKGLQLDGWKITPFYKPKVSVCMVITYVVVVFIWLQNMQNCTKQ